MIFLSIVLTLTCLVHFGLYRFVLRFLDLTRPAARAALLAVFTLLALSFMAAFFLLRWAENTWTIRCYQAAAVWFALAVNLILAVAATWLLYGFLRLAGVSPASFRPAAAGCVLLALGWSAWGFWSAFHPVVTAVEINLPNLPHHWRGRTIVQISDLHLGHFHGLDSLQRLAARIDDLQPDLLVITGDLFDGLSGRMAEFIEPLRHLRARYGVYYVTGNHEVYAGLRRCLDAVSGADIRVLFNEMTEVDGLALIGVAYPGIRELGEIRGIAGLPAASADAARILLFHTPTDIRRDGTQDRRTGTYWKPDTAFTLSRELGVSLQLSGHTHKGQLFPFGWLTRWIYNGYDYGLHRIGDFSIYVSSGVGTWGPPMRTGTPPEITAIRLK